MDKLVATFSQSRNDMCWQCSVPDAKANMIGTYQPRTTNLMWTGYNDGFWWENVSKTDNAKIKKGNDGRVWSIDFDTNEVTEVTL